MRSGDYAAHGVLAAGFTRSGENRTGMCLVSQIETIISMTRGGARGGVARSTRKLRRYSRSRLDRLARVGELSRSSLLFTIGGCTADARTRRGTRRASSERMLRRGRARSDRLPRPSRDDRCAVDRSRRCQIVDTNINANRNVYRLLLQSENTLTRRARHALDDRA